MQESHTAQKYTQLFLLTNDIIKILKNAPELEDVNSSKDFDNMLKTISNIPIKLDNNKRVSVQVKATDRTININSLKNWNNIQKDIFLLYLRNKDLIMPDFFYNMLLDTLNPKSNLTDIKRDIPSLNAGMISTWREFEKIEFYYFKITNDNSIFQIPWKEIISFKGDKLNINYLSCEEWYLLLENDAKTPFFKSICSGKKLIDSPNELPLSEEQMANLNYFALSSDDRKIEVSIKLPLKDNKDIISIIVYDIATKKVLNVSMAL